MVVTGLFGDASHMRIRWTLVKDGLYFSRVLLLALLIGLSLASDAGESAEVTETGIDHLDPQKVEFFELKIRPILVENCFKCHGEDPEKLKGGFNMMESGGLMRGGDTGSAIKPGDPENSDLIEAIRYTNEDFQMPPKSKLPDLVIADFEKWVRDGAVNPIAATETATATQPESNKGYDFSAGREHWAYKPMVDYGPPAISNEEWPQNSIDNFVLARRFAESGLRFLQVTHGHDVKWDHHSGLHGGISRSAYEVDKPIAGLLKDLKSRGLLDETLVLWGGEFGRTPGCEGEGRDGRDHNPHGFTMFMAGGGVKGGFSYGETDDFGYYAVKDKVHIHDLHALGLDHEKLTFRHQGRDFRLTDVEGNVAHAILV